MLQFLLLFIPAAIGILMGTLYIFSGFKDSGKVESLQSNPRVKNLLWIVSGAIGVLLADWKIFSDAGLNVPPRGEFVVCYLTAAVASALLILLGLSITMFIGAVRNRQSNIRNRAFDLVLTFLAYGFPKYFDLKKELFASLVVEDLIANIGAGLSTSIACALRDREAGSSTERRESTLNQLMDAAANIVKLISRDADLKIRVNYMVCISRDHLQKEAATAPFFKYGKEERYEQYFVLRRYRDGPKSAICLPVEPRSSGARPLPGAPDAYCSGEPSIINCQKFPKCDWVPAPTQKSMVSFFKAADFESVLSLPILNGNSRIGVLNIESSRSDILWARSSHDTTSCRGTDPVFAAYGRGHRSDGETVMSTSIFGDLAEIASGNDKIAAVRFDQFSNYVRGAALADSAVIVPSLSTESLVVGSTTRISSEGASSDHPSARSSEF